jgi:hypothetical protein
MFFNHYGLEQLWQVYKKALHSIVKPPKCSDKEDDWILWNLFNYQ